MKVVADEQPQSGEVEENGKMKLGGGSQVKAPVKSYEGGSNNMLIATKRKSVKDVRKRAANRLRAISFANGVWVPNNNQAGDFESVDYHWDTGSDMDTPLYQSTSRKNMRSSIYGFINTNIFKRPAGFTGSDRGSDATSIEDSSISEVEKAKEGSMTSDGSIPKQRPSSVGSAGRPSRASLQAGKSGGSVEDMIQSLAVFQEAFGQGETTPWRRRLRTVTDMWIPVIVTGILVGVTASLMGMIYEALGSMKVNAIKSFLVKDDGSSDKGTALVVFVLLSVVFMGASILATLGIAPMAAASGIPETKAFLNGCVTRGIFGVKTFLVKVLGNCLAIASGAPIGREGPMVHIGALVAVFVSYCATKMPGYHAWTGPGFEHEQRDLVTAGISAGIAAVFNAPIGGVLFAQEDVSSFWSNRLTWKAFICSVVAQITVTSWRMTFLNGDAFTTLMIKGENKDIIWQWTDMPVFVVLGIVCGLLMAVYQTAGLYCHGLRKRFCRSQYLYLLEGCVYIAVVSAVMFLLADFTKCEDIPSNLEESYASDHRKWQRFVCAKGQHSPMASLSLSAGSGLSESVILQLLGVDAPTDTFEMMPLLIFLLVFFFFSCMVIGIQTPYGLFVPLMVTGGIMGRVTGLLANEYYDTTTSHSGMYALMGMAACLGGFTRMTVAITTIFLETTGSPGLLSPVMLTIIVAKTVMDYNCPVPFFDVIIHRRRMPFLEPHAPPSIKGKTAGNLMSSDIVCLTLNESVKNMVQVLLCTTHNGFPIVSKPQNADPKSMSVVKPFFHGIITRQNIFKVLQVVVRNDARGRVTDDTIFVPSQLMDLDVDLSPACMDTQMYIPLQLPAYKTYRMFTELGIRHLCVVSEDGRLLGIITREDLMAAASGEEKEDGEP